MKRQEIKMKLLLSIERTKTKYELMSEKLENLITNLNTLKEQFTNTSYKEFIQLSNDLSNISLAIEDNYKTQETILDPKKVEDIPFKDKQVAIRNAITQIKANHESLKKNTELIKNITTELGKNYDAANTNMDGLKNISMNLKNSQISMMNKTIKIKDEITVALIDNDCSEKKLYKLNSETKMIEKKTR